MAGIGPLIDAVQPVDTGLETEEVVELVLETGSEAEITFGPDTDFIRVFRGNHHVEIRVESVDPADGPGPSPVTLRPRPTPDPSEN